MMRSAIRASVLGASSLLALASCADFGPLDPSLATGVPGFDVSSAAPTVWISEFHYDNDGTDAGEFIEVMGVAGTSVTGWSIVLYNGSNGAPYNTAALSGSLTDSCSGYGVTVVDYPANGIQNGSPDAIALVDGLGNVVSFLSYEGGMVGVGGPADGMTAEDIGVSETSTTPIGQSLQRGAGGVWQAPAASTKGVCNGEAPGGDPDPPPPASGDVFISEFHYDNISTDAGEAIEVQGPAGTNLSGWSIVLYNGNGGGTYNSAISLSGVITDSCTGSGTISFDATGLQNGSPDGFALVNASGTVVEFLSYEGVITATDGPANGMTSVDVGVSEGTDTPVGQSLQKINGTWTGPATSSFGACNSGGTPPPTGATTIIINELMGDPVSAESASWGEWFEVYNYGTASVNLQGWTIASAGSNQPDHTIGSSVVIPAGGYAVLGRGADSNRNGGVTLAYNYYTSSTTIWLDNSDWLALRDPAGLTVDSVAWSSLPQGATRGVRDALAPNSDVDGANWGYATVTFGAGDYGTPNAANGTQSDTAPTPPTPGGTGSLSINGRTSSDPPLPIGFQDQLFSSGSAPFTWSSTTPAIASVNADGVITALAAGSANFRVDDANGSFGTITLAMSNATAGSASYQNHVEFGTPTDATPSDDFIITRNQFVTSYNSTRGTPNWVSYNLDASHFGAEDRCDCFTHDPALPSSYTVLTTADYTGAGGYAGYGIDRGHLARSFDRTSGSLDNATTYYFSNIVPQAADNNQGPWAIFENELGDRARLQNREVYIIAGVAGNIGTVKGEGKIVIPQSVWKVAVIMPRDEGVSDVDAASDIEVIAVIMPNVPGIRNTPWSSYTTTVYAIEQATGYDLLSALPDGIEAQVSGAPNTAPVLSSIGASTLLAGETLTVSGSFTDPNADNFGATVDYGDGTGVQPLTLNGKNYQLSHVYEDAGSYNVTVAVSDGTATTSTTGPVTVISSSDLVRSMFGDVDAAMDAGKIQRGAGIALKAKLTTLYAAMQRDRGRAANALVRTFIIEVRVFMRVNRVDDAVGADLIADAERLLAVM